MTAPYGSATSPISDPYAKPPTPAYSMHNLSSAKPRSSSTPKGSTFQTVLVHLLLWTVVLAYALICPFTKVEESFNVQAIHDIVRHGVSREALLRYDHRLFPGVVPRTFIGALILSPLVKLYIVLLKSFLPNDLYAVRLAVGTFGCVGMSFFLSGVSQALGQLTAINAASLLFTQFHYNYYLSRPLPNTFASISCLLVFGLFLRRKNVLGLALLAMSAVIFRHELLALVAANVAMHAGFKLRNCGPGLRVVFLAMLVGAALSLIIDSYFWGHWLIPEWAVSPWHWYISNGLVKSIPLAIILSLFGILWKVPGWKMVVPCGLYLSMFSILPHKELRFLFPIFPVFSLIGGSFLVNLYCPICLFLTFRKCRKPLLYSMASSLVVLAQAALLMTTIGRVYVSSWNYPGGHFHAELAKFLSPTQPALIHVDTLTAMTGFSRFTEDQFPIWSFDKTENVDPAMYDFVISSEAAPPPSFEHIAHVDAFSGFNWYPLDEVLLDARILKLRLPFHMNITPTLHIHRRIYSREEARVNSRAEPVVVKSEAVSTFSSQPPTSEATSTFSTSSVIAVEKPIATTAIVAPQSLNAQKDTSSSSSADTSPSSENVSQAAEITNTLPIAAETSSALPESIISSTQSMVSEIPKDSIESPSSQVTTFDSVPPPDAPISGMTSESIVAVQSVDSQNIPPSAPSHAKVADVQAAEKLPGPEDFYGSDDDSGEGYLEDEL